jgi:hypothetical protein
VGTDRAVTKLAGDPPFSVEKSERMELFAGEGNIADLLILVVATGEVEGVVVDVAGEEEDEGSTSRRDLDRISTSLRTLPIGLTEFVVPASPIVDVPPTTESTRSGVERNC